MTSKKTTTTEKLETLYKEIKALDAEILQLHGEADIKLDAFFDEGSPGLEAAFDSLIAEAKEKMEKKAAKQLEIDILLDGAQ